MTLKSLVFLIFTCTFASIQGQSFETILFQGKREFKLENYNKAYETFKKASALNPNDPEAHYFMGECLFKINSPNAVHFPQLSLEFTVWSSEEFEIASKLPYKKTNDMYKPDPYSGITCIWGAQALKYLYFNKRDSAKWALKQGKARGGFGDFFMALNRLNIQKCRKNAFLFLEGDNYIFYCLYLQIVEKFRTDVKIVSPNLLNTYWYPHLLKNNFNIEFDLSDNEIDSCGKIEWKDSIMTINNFSWKIKPDSEYKCLWRQDQLLLSILKQNQLKDEINLTYHLLNFNNLSFGDSICEAYFLLRLGTFPVEFNFEDINAFSQYLYLSDLINFKSELELMEFNKTQFYVLRFIELIIQYDNKENAEKLMAMYDKHFEYYGRAYTDNNLQKYYNEVKQQFTKE